MQFTIRRYLDRMESDACLICSRFISYRKRVGMWYVYASQLSLPAPSLPSPSSSSISRQTQMPGWWSRSDSDSIVVQQSSLLRAGNLKKELVSVYTGTHIIWFEYARINKSVWLHTAGAGDAGATEAHRTLRTVFETSQTKSTTMRIEHGESYRTSARKRHSSRVLRIYLGVCVAVYVFRWRIHTRNCA